MIVELQQNGKTLYSHAAWADDLDGTHFSLTAYEGAIYVGNFQDNSKTEATDPGKYNWQYAIEGIDEEVIENDEELDTNELTSIVADLTKGVDDANSKVAVVANDLESTQNSTDNTIGKVNELMNTNQGATGWTVPSGYAVSGYVDNPTEDVNNDKVNITRITKNAATASNIIYFDSGVLAEKLSATSDDNTYTFSANIKMSTSFEMPLALEDIDGSNMQMDFGVVENVVIENEDTPEEVAEDDAETADGEEIPVGDEDVSADDEEDIEAEGTVTGSDLWIYHTASAESAGVETSNQMLCFDLTNMAVGSTLDITNLKIEAGAMATPWRESLEEINSKVEDAVTRISNIEADYIKTNELAVAVARISVLEANEITTEYLEANYADIGLANIADAVITSAKIESLDAGKITTGNIDAARISAGVIDAVNASISSAVIDGAKIGDLNAKKITTGNIDAARISAGVIDAVNASISSAVIDGAKIGDLNAKKITTGNIDAARISAGVIDAVNASVSSAVIDAAKIGNLNADKITTGDIDANRMKTNVIDAVSAYTGNAWITNAMIQDGVINTAQIADASITSAKIVELTANLITAGTLSVERLILRGTDQSLVYALNNIDGATQLTETSFDTLNAGDVLTDRSITADKIVAKEITAAEIAANVITANEILAGTITSTEIAANTITADNIAANTITADRIAGNTLTLGQMAPTLQNDIQKGIDASITANELSEYKAGLDLYLDFSSGTGLVLGNKNSPFKTNITNTQLSFTQNEQPVAWIDTNGFNFTEGVVNNNLKIGNFLLNADDNGAFGII